MSIKEKTLELLQKNLPEGVMLYPFDMSILEISERVRLKCQIPLCPNYGMSKVCPPNMPRIPMIKKAFEEFEAGYIIAQKINLKDLELDSIDEAKRPQKIEALQSEMLDIIRKLENVLMKEGFEKVIGLGPGSCHLCEKCTPIGEPCRHPLKARPGPSAMGIDITSLAKKIGIQMQWGSKDEILSMGMLFV